MSEFKVKAWDGKEIFGSKDHPITITYKLDGVRLHVDDGEYTTRTGKPIYNIPPDVEDGVYEVYLGTWESTVSAVRSKNQKIDIAYGDLYKIDNLSENILIHKTIGHTLTTDSILELLVYALRRKFEGLVLHHKGGLTKIVASENHDVKITGLIEGKGRNVGKLGAFTTDMGNVGTGFTDKERTAYFDKIWIGSIIEVGCKELTPQGKFRHPRFIRHRWDKE